MPKFSDRLKHAWNAFRNNRDPTSIMYDPYAHSSSYRLDRPRLTRGNERSIVNAVYNRIAADVSAITIKHVRVDENGRYKETLHTGLNSALTLDANIDQTGRQFIQDVVISMLDEGCVAIVPVDTTLSPYLTGSFDVNSLRVGKVTQWYPKHVKVEVYNEERGIKEEVILPKDHTAIIENPFYSVMNEPSSTLQRLIRKLNLLDVVDEQSSAGKLDLIIQLPYIVKSEARKQQAESRRKAIEDQLMGSKYGVAYTDGTEHITQLNRSINNNLMEQIEYLTKLLYSQLGITEDILNGTANEVVMLNYNNRTIEPILAAICDEISRKFITKTARTQGQTIMFFRDPFRLVPVANIADIADKFTRNEIMSSNEIRAIIGMAPSNDPDADELRNKNLNQSDVDAEEKEEVAEEEVEESSPMVHSDIVKVSDEDVKIAKELLLGAGFEKDDLFELSDEDLVNAAFALLDS